MTPPPAPKIALVSGGSRGIGAAVVLRLAEDGWDVSFCYRSDEEAARLVEKEATERGARCLPVRADVSDPVQAKSWVARTEDELGPVSAVVANAGITRDRPLVMMSDDDWHQVMDTNLDGVFHTCRAAVFPMLKRRSGRIVTLSSVAGVHGNAGQTNYSAAKAGIIGFTKSLAKEVGPHGIRANVVAPGLIDTDMTDTLPAAARERLLSSIALRRFGTAAEVAALTAFLLSDQASYLTGTVLEAHGGLTL
ncbi:3-oxoacyl-[acyl-carrier-protein] reductase [Streptomyces spiroverticillatus]|uniref:3-oxoacyl-[acyl-carrier-protein] reductase n=1 Tax=Streptomyces finlayi TaxID=67296 RepID=A0A918WYQ8_9ACTN|nr:3-oxoacyl-[acyl-carrier-protein] reductase [Streptomyces finlayi]GHA15855.1 3-oxoacyl-[acyl-carrier-protein] reductase [Streptomyces spiroverticillatus]GHC96442.1 3-oxoacyl-[acyl-carrier-protein] reductase [Streptomyces finlayi]